MKSRLVVITAAIVAVLWAQTLSNIYERRGNAIREAERETATLARTLEVQAVNSIAAADLLLRVAIQKIHENDWLDDPDGSREAQIRAYLRDIQRDLPQVLNLVLFDSRGHFRAQSVGPLPKHTGPTDAEHYRMLAEHPDLDQYISHAFRGRLTDRLIFSVARRIRDADGAFIGLLVAGIDPNYFNEIYASLNMGKDGIIALFDNRGTMLDRFPSDSARPTGRSFADRPLFTEQLPRSPHGTYMGPPNDQGRVNIIGYRRIEGSPLTITVSKSRDEVLAPWWRDSRRECLTIAIVTLLLLFGCSIILREIASRRISERSLKDSEERFRSTFDHAPVGIAQLDLDGHWLMTNPALRDMLGYTETELRLTRMPEITAPEDRAATKTAWEAMIRGDLELYTAEKRYIRKDGQNLWVSCTATLRKTSRGKPRGILVIMADITARKAMDADLLAKSEQLRESEETSRKQALILESIISSMADAVMVADENNRFLLVNPAAHRLYGVRTDDRFEPETYAANFGIHHLDKKTLLTPDQVPLLRALRGESTDSAEVFVRNAIRPDGVHLSISARPMRDQTGAIRGGVVVCRDVSAVRQTSEALRQAQKMEAVGQLTGGIAHDFNNLLQVIIGNNEILAENLQTDSRDEKLARMTLMAARRGAELTNQLLSFSRRQALQPRPTDIQRLIAESEGLMQRAGGASVAIKRVFAPDLWDAVVDPGMLQTALLNLVFNARDAMPDGGRITIEATNIVCDHAYVSRHGVVRPGEYVLISVSDSGAGIPPGLLERVFEPFFTTKDVGKGSGLGLSMVYGFVQQSDGAVRIESAEGKGTTVYLYLPRSRVKAPIETVAPPKSVVPRGSETILVVEDDALVRDFAVGALRGLGYTVLAAADGDAALHTLRIHKEPVHLLFSDIVMPGGITGWQLAEIATAMRPSLKVLLTSGYAEGSAGHGRDNAAFGAVLAKPYGKTALATSVRNALAANQKIRVN